MGRRKWEDCYGQSNTPIVGVAERSNRRKAGGRPRRNDFQATSRSWRSYWWPSTVGAPVHRGGSAPPRYSITKYQHQQEKPKYFKAWGRRGGTRQWAVSNQNSIILHKNSRKQKTNSEGKLFPTSSSIAYQMISYQIRIWVFVFCGLVFLFVFLFFTKMLFSLQPFSDSWRGHMAPQGYRYRNKGSKAGPG